MAFLPKRFDSGKLIRMACADAQAITKGEALYDNGSGYLEVAVAADTSIPYVAMETVTTTAAGQEVLCVETRGVEFEADTDANPAQTDVGTVADLANSNQVNPDAVAGGTVFYIKSIKGPVTDNKVIGFFTQPESA